MTLSADFDFAFLYGWNEINEDLSCRTFFNEEEIKNIEKAEKILFSRGFDVFSPRLNEVRNEENTQDKLWSKETFMNDKRFIDWADVVVMLYYGGYSDSGTAWECGYAYGTNTPVVVVHLG